MIAVAVEQRPHKPSVQKYGTILAEGGFTQFPRPVEDYLNTLNLCSTAILLLIILSSYRWAAEQEFYPSVKTLAERCGVSQRRINQLTKQLAEIGLIVKCERFAGRSQLSNYYDIEPLFQRAAAWKDARLVATLAEEESQADAPFEPRDVLEEAAQIVSEQFGESEPRQIRYNILRLDRRWNSWNSAGLEWNTFVDIVDKAREQTEERRKEPTRTGKAFTKLVAYFFSALDYWLSRQKPEASPQPTTQPQGAQNKEPKGNNQQSAQQAKGPQQPRKSGLLAERAAARRAAEAAGRARVKAPETLALHIRAAAATFNDDQERSSVQRAANMMADARLEEQTMLDLVAEARSAASQCTQIKKRNKHGKINRMPYFFQVLEQLVTKAIDIS